MKYIVKKASLILICLSMATVVVNAENYKGKKIRKKINKSEVDKCSRAQGSAEISINNVRARINTSGNMWYDGSVSRYYVPKTGESTPMFCAALWIGGQDANFQLRVAALRFGSEGEDFWPGPLSVDNNASVDREVCDYWDKILRITKAEVEQFVAGFDENGVPDLSKASQTIRKYAEYAHGDKKKNQSRFLAPFFDADLDGEYDYTKGDYPYYDFENKLCPTTLKAALPPGVPYTPIPTMESDPRPQYGTGGIRNATGGLLVDQVLKGDETLWWVFNDKGNSHTESRFGKSNRT